MRCVTRKLKPVYKKIDVLRKELNRQIDVMPHQISGIPEFNVKIVKNMDEIKKLLLEFSNIHANWRGGV